MKADTWRDGVNWSEINIWRYWKRKKPCRKKNRSERRKCENIMSFRWQRQAVRWIIAHKLYIYRERERKRLHRHMYTQHSRRWIDFCFISYQNKRKNGRKKEARAHSKNRRKTMLTTIAAKAQNAYTQLKTAIDTNSVWKNVIQQIY